MDRLNPLCKVLGVWKTIQWGVSQVQYCFFYSSIALFWQLVPWWGLGLPKLRKQLIHWVSCYFGWCMQNILSTNKYIIFWNFFQFFSQQIHVFIGNHICLVSFFRKSSILGTTEFLLAIFGIVLGWCLHFSRTKTVNP